MQLVPQLQPYSPPQSVDVVSDEHGVTVPVQVLLSTQEHERLALQVVADGKLAHGTGVPLQV